MFASDAGFCSLRVAACEGVGGPFLGGGSLPHPLPLRKRDTLGSGRAGRWVKLPRVLLPQTPPHVPPWGARASPKRDLLGPPLLGRQTALSVEGDPTDTLSVLPSFLPPTRSLFCKLSGGAGAWGQHRTPSSPGDRPAVDGAGRRYRAPCPEGPWEWASTSCKPGLPEGPSCPLWLGDTLVPGGLGKPRVLLTLRVTWVQSQACWSLGFPLLTPSPVEALWTPRLAVLHPTRIWVISPKTPHPHPQARVCLTPHDWNCPRLREPRGQHRWDITAWGRGHLFTPGSVPQAGQATLLVTLPVCGPCLFWGTCLSSPLSGLAHRPRWAGAQGPCSA